MRRLILSLDDVPVGWSVPDHAATSARPLGWDDLAPPPELLVTTNSDAEPAQRQLGRLGFVPGSAQLIKPTELRRACAGSEGEVLLASANAGELSWAARRAENGQSLVPVAVVEPTADGLEQLEAAGAWFAARDARELFDLVAAPKREVSLSVVLMAYNERATIAAAIAEVRRFCRLYLRDYEILVVDDGSHDGTAEAAEAESAGDVRVLRHRANRGMGATMRSGYSAAQHDYLVALPADRQIRAQQLCALLPRWGPDRCVHGYYRIPHSGPLRAVMSAAFRVVVQRVGGLRVDFAGAYVFHRRWLAQIDLERLYAHSFVFSFELLEQLRRHRCAFEGVEMRAFSRVAGQSRVARPGRIARVFGEVVNSRARRALRRLPYPARGA